MTMPRMRGWRLILVGTIVLCLGAVATVQCRELVNEVFPRRALVTPVLVMDVDLGTSEPQSEWFSLKYSGRYSVNASLKLRHGPQGMPADAKTFVLTGEAEILDQDGESVLVGRAFERALLEYEVGAKLFDFDADEVGLKGKKLFRIALRVEPAFQQHYSSMTVYIRKEMKYPIVD